MIGWSIVILFGIIIGVIGASKMIKADFEGGLFVIGFIMLVVGIISFVLSIGLTIAVVEVNKEISDFKQTQNMLDETMSNDDTFDVALNLKVIEWNEWLLSSKNSNNIYGIFSLVPDKIHELEYIKITKDS